MAPGRHRATLSLRAGTFMLLVGIAALYRHFSGGHTPALRRRLRQSPIFEVQGNSANLTTSMSSKDFLSPRRRLASPGGGCIACPNPTGGPLSITGALSGQCACKLDAAGQCAADSTTCCGALDAPGLAILLYGFMTLYSFLGLAIICDAYFCESLEKISTKLKLSDDVAGATFMAVGSSAPELFTAVVTTLITGGTEGIGTIVGSAIFNIMMIVGVTCFCAGQVLDIWWYPLTRDAVVYVMSVLAMYVVLLDGVVTVGESIGLCLGYVGYIVLMVKNADITRVVQDWEQRRKDQQVLAEQQLQYPGATLDELKKLVERERSKSTLEREREEHDKRLAAAIAMDPLKAPRNRVAVNDTVNKRREEERARLRDWGEASRSMIAVHHSRQKFLTLLRSRREGVPPPRVVHDVSSASNSFDLPAEISVVVGHVGVHAMHRNAERNEMPIAEWPWDRIRNWEVSTHSGGAMLLLNIADAGTLTLNGADQDVVRKLDRHLRTWKPGAWSVVEGEDNEGALTIGRHQLRRKHSYADWSASMPIGTRNTGGGVCSCAVQCLSAPLDFMLRWTVPDCSQPQNESKFMVTFLMSIVWIGMLSFVMVDFAARLGCVLNVPPLVMGLIVIAAGTSVPDALSSILVARNGQGDMAVANVLGSNIFNIFLGLGLPWLLKTMADGPLTMDATGLELSIVILLLYIVFFMIVIMRKGWKLDQTVGKLFYVAYGLYVIWTLLTMLDNPVIKL